MKHILFIVSLLLVVSCNSKKATNEIVVEEKGPQVINIEEAIGKPSVDILLSEALNKLDVLPLETTQECLLSDIGNIQIMNDNIIILDFRAGICRFSRDGKFLNKIGSRGQGPGEYLYPKNIMCDGKSNRICIQESDGRGDSFKWYDLNGRFICEQPSQKQRLYYGMNGFVFNFKGNYFAVDRLAFLEENIKMNEKRTNYWSCALLDTSFNVKREYMNPDFIGREQSLWENRFTGAMANHWTEEGPFIDISNDNLSLLYFQGDTIYQYQSQEETFVPEYILTLGSKSSFEEAHKQYNRDQSYFNALSVHAFAQTRDHIYFQATQSDNAYTIAYNKNDGSVDVYTYETKIESRRFPQFPDYELKYYVDNKLYLQNDIVGDKFSVDFKSSGKYWISIIDSDRAEDYVATREDLQNVLKTRNVDDNPILLIGELK